MNYRDVENLNQSITGLSDTLLRQRMLEQQKQDKAAAQGMQERELGLREREATSREALARDQMQRELDQTKYERDPNNPKNQEASSLAALHNKQMEQLGIKTFKSSWSSGGRKIDMEGTKEEIAQAVKDNPPDAKENRKVSFTTKDGVTITQEGPAGAMDALVQQYQSQIRPPTDRNKPQVHINIPGQPDDSGKPTTVGDLSGSYDNPQLMDYLNQRAGTNAPAFTQRGAAPLPKQKADLVTGKTYKTARGNARWDGSQFTPVE